MVLAVRAIATQTTFGLSNGFFFGIVATVSANGTRLRLHTLGIDMQAGGLAAFWGKGHGSGHQVLLNIDGCLCPLSNSPGGIRS